MNALQGTEETKHGFSDLTPCLAVVVQEQIDSDVAGIAFSLNPVTNDYDKAVIDANWGSARRWSTVASRPTTSS